MDVRGAGEESIAFVDERDRASAVITKDTFEGGGFASGLEILRGDLAKLLVNRSAGEVDYLFGDSIAALEDRGADVGVTFASRYSRRFDLVIVAERMNSRTRRLVFGEVEICPSRQYTGYFTIPRASTDTPLARWFNAPGGLNVSCGRTTTAPRAL